MKNEKFFRCKFIANLSKIILNKVPYKRFQVIRPFIREKSVLDIGCVGVGYQNIPFYKNPLWMHGLIAKEAKTILGIDNDEKGVKKLRDLGYNVILCNAEDFNLHKKFDVIIAGELMEHLTNFDGFLNCVKKHIKKEGLFILSTPNPFFWFYFIEILFKGSQSFCKDHTCYFDEITMKQLLQIYDFDVFDIKYMPGAFPPIVYFLNIIPVPRKKLRYTTMVFFARLKI